MSLEFPWYLSQIVPSGSRGSLRCMIFIRYPHMWIERSESSIRTRKSHAEIQAWQSLRKQVGGYEVSTACGNPHKGKAFVACLIHLQNGAAQRCLWPCASWFSVLREDPEGASRASAVFKSFLEGGYWSHLYLSNYIDFCKFS